MAETVPAPLISVVIPTRDRPDQLARCLAALERQRAKESLEVIVVDDGSTDPAAVDAVVERARARVVHRAAGGPAAARNTGVRAARGTYLCFTDDDCEPESDWIERLKRSLDAGAVAVAGQTVNGSPDNPFAEASEMVAMALSTPAPNGAKGISFARSNNLGCRVHVLVAIPFDERFPAAAGEDRDWCSRLIAAGHVLESEPTAVVVHRQQLGFRDFWRQQVRYGRGAFQFRARSRDRARLEPPSFYAQLIGRAFRQGTRTGLIMCLAQTGTAVGFIAAWTSSLFSYAKHRER